MPSKSLGNHEFDEGVNGLIPFIRNLSAPILAANLIVDKVPEMQGMENLYKSIIIVKNQVRIGLIGYVTAETKFLAPKNNVEYEDEVISIRREVKKMKEQDVNILIALGHSGFVKDLEIARNVEDLDLVIGGHSNTFLWNEDSITEKPEVPQGPYPTEVKQTKGRIVRVVQAYAYTKYMGKLQVIFDLKGEIIKCNGRPILLNQEVPRDPDLLQTVIKYRKGVNRIYNEVVGASLVFLDGECRLRECTLGDLTSDAMLTYIHEVHHEDFPNVTLAIIQAGRIRTSIDHSEKPIKMTRGDWVAVLPFSDTLSIVTINGTTLKLSLEHSVSTWRTIDSTGQFQQFSGMEVIYDLARPVGSRVVKAGAVCSSCEYKGLSEIKDSYEYQVIMPSFIAEGGDGYIWFESLPKINLSFNELDCVLYYLSKNSPINPQLDGRITILNEDRVVNTLENGHSSTNNLKFAQFSLYYVLLVITLSKTILLTEI